MRLATTADGTRDGELWVVSRDGTRAVSGSTVAPSLRVALEEWESASAPLQRFADSLESDENAAAPFDAASLRAPLPRTWQWLDGSAYLNHGALMSRSLGIEPIIAPIPLMYQGMSHEFIAPTADARLWRPDVELDFEGEFAVILRDTPAGVSAEDALDYVALVTFVNDWSLRAVVREEMGRRFGFIEGKPATGMAPFAVTPDELGDAWRDGKLHLTLTVERDGELFGQVPSDEMDYTFGELIAAAARNRDLPAGTLIGSGTVSSSRYAETGSACIAERRGIEIIDQGAARTPYLAPGETVRMRVEHEGRSVFGDLVQTVRPQFD
jgi:fumarylacetoacetate (FAA) hydrolase